jgi:hypothetical protein
LFTLITAHCINVEVMRMITMLFRDILSLLASGSASTTILPGGFHFGAAVFFQEFG